MIVKLTRKINNSQITFDIDERETERALEMATFLATDDYCFNCKVSDKIKWQSNRAKGKEDGKEYIYVKRHCYNCGADSTMGKYLTGGLFWKQFEVYDKGEGVAPKNATSTPQKASNEAPHPADEVNIDDIPF